MDPHPSHKYISISVGNKSLPVLADGSTLSERPSQGLTQFLNKGDTLLLTLNSIAKNLDKILKEFDTDNRSETFFKGIANTAKNMSQASKTIHEELNQIQIKKTISHLNQIFEKIDNGTGTLGALVNDPGLYDQLRALFGGANRNRIIRNLVRQTVKESKEPKDPKITPSGLPEQ